ncbi:hypothetical protein [Ruminococcus flavefaciens]|uniref:hypothetical protein n=1 Tax=Ruminococcus flavefaciens TaxID=1265 RepID=UPI0026EC5E4E|nr:hypothetical protein [Ruminococcus flavefaciens]
MRAHIVGTLSSNYDTKKTDADEKKRIKNNLSQLLAFGMFADFMADGGYIKDGNRYWKEPECEVAKTEEDCEEE